MLILRCEIIGLNWEPSGWTVGMKREDMVLLMYVNMVSPHNTGILDHISLTLFHTQPPCLEIFRCLTRTAETCFWHSIKNSKNELWQV